MPIRHPGIVLLGACALSIAACSKNANKADTTAMAADTTAKAAAVTPTPPALTDTAIFGLLDEANVADSASGALAAKKGSSASVREFGHQMARDHHMLRKAGQDLAKKLNITPAPPTNDTLPAAAKRMGDSLTAEAKGPAWDKAYIDNEVAVHQSVLALLQTAQGAASDTSLKALIQKAQPTIQGHLTKAQDIQGKLNATATGGGAAAPGGADTTKPAHKKKG
jgi:putative membrane protein